MIFKAAIKGCAMNYESKHGIKVDYDKAWSSTEFSSGVICVKEAIAIVTNWTEKNFCLFPLKYTLNPLFTLVPNSTL